MSFSLSPVGIKISPKTNLLCSKSIPVKTISASISLAILKNPVFHFITFFLVPSGVIPNKITSLLCPKSDIKFFASTGASLFTGMPPSQLKKYLIPNLNIESFAKKLTFISSAKTKGKALTKSS